MTPDRYHVRLTRTNGEADQTPFTFLCNAKDYARWIRCTFPDAHIVDTVTGETVWPLTLAPRPKAAPMDTLLNPTGSELIRNLIRQHQQQLDAICRDVLFRFAAPLPNLPLTAETLARAGITARINRDDETLQLLQHERPIGPLVSLRLNLTTHDSPAPPPAQTTGPATATPAV